MHPNATTYLPAALAGRAASAQEPASPIPQEAIPYAEEALKGMQHVRLARPAAASYVCLQGGVCVSWPQGEHEVPSQVLQGVSTHRQQALTLFAAPDLTVNHRHPPAGGAAVHATGRAVPCRRRGAPQGKGRGCFMREGGRAKCVLPRAQAVVGCWCASGSAPADLRMQRHWRGKAGKKIREQEQHVEQAAAPAWGGTG